MSDVELLGRIATDPEIVTGKPVITGTRLTVEYILNRLGHGSTMDDLLAEYSGLTENDIRGCLLFAARAISDITFFPITWDAE